MRSANLSALATRTARRYLEEPLLSGGLPRPPRASLAEGAAGVAYFLFRRAAFGGGRASVEAAARWASRAEDELRAPGGLSSNVRITPRSLYHHEPGVRWMRALVGEALGEEHETRRAIASFCRTPASAGGPPWDVTLGSAGLLLGCAAIVEGVDRDAAVSPVRAAGGRLAAQLTGLIERPGVVPGETALGALGAAHGWGGVAQALLRWSGATATAPPPQVLALLERLTAARTRSGLWPKWLGSREVWAGWCHGSAGWAQLWTLASQVTGETHLLEMAERAADDAVEYDQVIPNLCCGRAGQGFAALTLYRATGERRWLAAAHRVAGDAARRTDTTGPFADSLLAGHLGVALLATELEDPSRAGMPVYQKLS